MQSHHEIFVSEIRVFAAIQTISQDSLKKLKEENSEKQKKIKQNEKDIQKLGQQLEVAQQIAKKSKDLTYLKQNRKKIFQSYLSILDPSNFENPFPQDPNAKHFMIIGDISSGKSSFINFFYGKNQEVGVGQTTSVVKQIPGYQIPGTNKTIYIWDTPGKNEEFNVRNHDFLSKFVSADKIFVLNKKSAKDVSEMVQVLYKLNSKKIYYVRTQCDAGLSRPTIQQLAEVHRKDKQYFEQIGIFSIPMFQIAVSSSKNKISMEEYDNTKMLKELTEWK